MKEGKKTKKKEVKKNTKSNKTVSKVKKIIKRSGRVVPFKQEKVVAAVLKAFKETGEGAEKEAEKVGAKVVQMLNKQYRDGSVPEIEEVQDVVEKVLMVLDFDETAKAYILYRDQHRKVRETKDALKDAIDLVEGYISESDWRVKENSNMGFSLQGLNNHISSAVSSKYWMNRVYTKNIRDAHENGDLHVHDLQMVAAYCCGWDLRELLVQGFGGVMGKVVSAPPKHFRSALGQVVNFIYTLQGEANGAQAFANFDTLLAPFVHYDKLSQKEVKQAIQEFVFNMNVPTRVGFQTPFSNITMDLQVPSNFKDEPVVIGGKLQKKKYGAFQKEMNMINKAFAEVMTEGDAQNRVFTFPIPTYNISKEFDWEDPALKPIWEMTAKYGMPYFANFVNSDMSPDDARSMCCRLRLDNRELRKRGGGLFGANPMTGSIGVVTINMPRIGYLAKDKKEFFQKLDELMDIAKESLEAKRIFIERLTEIGLYPYSRHYLKSIKMRRGKYWSNHFSTIGLVGMNEALLNLIGKDITTYQGNRLAQKILNHMRDKMVKYQKETDSMYNLEATPAEGTTYRLAKADQKRFPDMIFANDNAVKNEGAEPYYTNSSQLPVGHTSDIFEALDLQDGLQTKYTGGTVLHGFLGEKINDLETVKNLVRTIASKYSLPYFTFTPTFSICPVHGYIAGEHQTCPKCAIEIKKKDVKFEKVK
ncbi:MAG: ribonucleoside triphosphate reductase [Candidatus Moranbacteria bacterium]|nr:ribonucleoside triphosphate reductase [Candidatus Moranbacteria bacterium]